MSLRLIGTVPSRLREGTTGHGTAASAVIYEVRRESEYHGNRARRRYPENKTCAEHEVKEVNLPCN